MCTPTSRTFWCDCRPNRPVASPSCFLTAVRPPDNPSSLRIAQFLSRRDRRALTGHLQNRETYGVRRLQPELMAQGFSGLDRIAHLRHVLGLRCKQKRRFNATTNSKHDLPDREMQSQSNRSVHLFNRPVHVAARCKSADDYDALLPWRLGKAHSNVTP